MRKMLQKLTLVAILAFISGGLFAQVTVSGVVYDADNNETLFGATVVKKGTSLGTTTDMNGKFTLQVDAGESELLVSFVGYTTATYTINAQDGESVDLGDLSLKSDSEMLNEVVVSGVVDIAQDRKTPVAVSTLRSSEIQQLIGTKELPEVLNYTPSVYATKQGGAFGDSRINIRGFDQRNTAVMINGMPVNDMENGWVYWSNWAGLADVTSAMQVQRGLGSSKLAISSVGGTINILTKTTDIDQGGKLDLVYGNDNYLKTLASYNTGKMDNGFAASVLLGRTAGDGYVTGTKFEAYNYYLAFGYETGNHNFQLTITGAPQVHNQRTTSFFNMADLADYQKYGNKYNYNHGYLNGEEFNWRRNFYHKPIASLNWDWDINETTRLSTVLYASFGRGGGTGDIGVGP
jgi:VCBS repeat-containing protein